VVRPRAETETTEPRKDRVPIENMYEYAREYGQKSRGNWVLGK